MKLVWCPETASNAYIDAVKVAEDGTAAEFVAAMAGGWKAQLVVEAWERGGGAATSLGLAAAVQHTQGRHVCVVPDERSAEEYTLAVRRKAAEVLVGEAEEVMGGLEGVDLVVVDMRRRDAARVVREARPGIRGMVVICGNVGDGRWRAVACVVEAAEAGGRRLVRSVFLPVGTGVQILHVGVGKGPSIGCCGAAGGRRWIRHVDRRTGEEHVFRRR